MTAAPAADQARVLHKGSIEISRSELLTNIYQVNPGQMRSGQADFFNDEVAPTSNVQASGQRWPMLCIALHLQSKCC
jgi:hypothetical protein